MPEIVNDSALLVNPFEVTEITDAMVKLFRDKTIQHQLVEKGIIRKQQFSWDKTANLLWQSIEKTI
jgi:hypothetical protein